MTKGALILGLIATAAGTPLAAQAQTPASVRATPPLSTVRVGIAELGARALERLLAAVEEGEAFERRHEVQPTSLMIRGTCGAGASSGGEISEGTAMNDLHPRRWVR